MTRLSTCSCLQTVDPGISALTEPVGIEALETVYNAAIEIPGGECEPVLEFSK